MKKYFSPNTTYICIEAYTELLGGSPTTIDLNGPTEHVDPSSALAPGRKLYI